MYPLFTPFLQSHAYYWITFSIVKEEALLITHSETFSAHWVYGFTDVMGSSKATKVGGCSSTANPMI